MFMMDDEEDPNDIGSVIEQPFKSFQSCSTFTGMNTF
jgi:hypothetical protein